MKGPKLGDTAFEVGTFRGITVGAPPRTGPLREGFLYQLRRHLVDGCEKVRFSGGAKLQ